MTWKGRKELPSIMKTKLQFDIDKLRGAVAEMEGKDWNACIGGPLNDLREAYGGRLSKIAYNKTNDEIDVNEAETYRYQQMALTKFNPDYEIPKDRESGSRWDKSFMKGDKKYDEREENFLLIDRGDNFFLESCLKKDFACLLSLVTSLNAILLRSKKLLKDFRSDK